ncbi:glycosyltransferase family 2 protein [Parabacteroides faecis]|uniref:Glycosyltransferase involved in cell wall biosynthesis n=1 Tax=Parabacteroides faecis TaxID=1217282 RepID=A0ABR6KN78_9BACT|nr:glycosyltransferase family 2 protein [Parabacteroides faecis]MBB4622347.1 glycosyltransferase involved in cell wall biosynthesis [Parabacteroides faecis]GGK11188.1 glycosyl transferase [Parabacteroides faecis]
MYKVTLSMPIYNVAPYVERALLSALNQTFESIEFLLVDDRGTDNSMEIVRRIIKDHPRGKDVRIIEHPHNIGTGATKNTAIDNAQGEFLFFMDSDDEITPGCIQVLYDKMIECPVDFVAGSMCEVINDSKTIDRVLMDTTRKGEFALSTYIYKDRKYFPIMLWNKLYNLKFLRINHIRCYDTHLNEDDIFSLHLSYYVRSFSFTSKITLRYFRRDSSTTGNTNLINTERIIRQEKDIVIELNKYLKMYNKESVYPYYLSFVIRVLFFLCFRFVKYRCTSDLEKKNFVDSLYLLDIKNWEVLRFMHKDIKTLMAFVYLMFPYKIKKIISRYY